MLEHDGSAPLAVSPEKEPSEEPPAAKTSPPALTDVVSFIVDDSLAFGEESPFRAAYAPGEGQLVVVTGENASGKSVFLRVAAEHFRSRDTLAVTISIRERTEEGIHRAFMFGDERTSATGAISIYAVNGALANLDRDGATVLCLDEPEFGLSEGYAHALGELIGAAAAALPTRCRGALIVTHSRPLVRGLLAGYGATPGFVLCGEERADLDHWLTNPAAHSVAELCALEETNLNRFLAFNKLFQEEANPDKFLVFDELVQP